MAIEPEKVKERQRADEDRFNRLLPLVQDPLVIILKGHLLIEEQLFLMLRGGLADPSSVTSLRLSFLQKLGLAKGTAGQFFADDVYTAVRRLNSIRNKLAHEAEPQNVELLIDQYLGWCGRTARFEKITGLGSRILQLRMVVGICWGYLTGVNDALSVVYDLMPRPQSVRSQSE